VTPLNLTAVAVERFVPPMVTQVPTGPVDGPKPDTTGCKSLTVKLLVVVAVPPGVVTDTGPVVAPVGTVAVMEVDEVALNVVAATPLNFTAVTP
jgi:hypothetical protein